MANTKMSFYFLAFFCLLLQLFSFFHISNAELEMNYYRETCPKAEEIRSCTTEKPSKFLNYSLGPMNTAKISLRNINAHALIRQQVEKLYYKHGNTAVSWLRNLFHDCIVKSCDASLLLETVKGVESEQKSTRSFGMRNFKYVKIIKDALEKACPNTVSCADIIALSARDGIVMLKGPKIEKIKTGRRDSRGSYLKDVDSIIPHHNASISSLLSSFNSIGIDVEAAVALLGAHSVGRVHCVNLVHRLYPKMDPTLDPNYALYLRKRCPTPYPNPKEVLYSRNDRETPMVVDNMYYKNIIAHKGLLVIDDELATDPRTKPFVVKMAASNVYFREQFSRGVRLLSETNPLTGDQGEIRKDCRYVN